MTERSLRVVAETTKLRCKVGFLLVGAGGESRSYVPRASALLATRNCLTFETWDQARGFVDRASASTEGPRGRREVWQLERDDGADVWLDFDHGSRELVLLEPIETMRAVGDPRRHVPGSRVVVERRGSTTSVVAARHGFARVIAVRGSFTTPLGRGDVLEYADLTGSGESVVHVRRTTNGLGSTTMVYAGRKLGVGEQMDLFGRWLSSDPLRDTSVPLTAGEQKAKDWFYKRFLPRFIPMTLMLLPVLFGCEDWN